MIINNINNSNSMINNININKAHKFEGTIMVEYLLNMSDATSRELLIKKGVGRELLGKVLQDKNIPEQAV